MNAARQNEQSIFHTFFKYVSSNVLGMIGFSCYILADVFFIARGIGADALAALAAPASATAPASDPAPAPANPSDHREAR